jgi:hypothetical protein
LKFVTVVVYRHELPFPPTVPLPLPLPPPFDTPPAPEPVTVTLPPIVVHVVTLLVEDEPHEI